MYNIIVSVTVKVIDGHIVNKDDNLVFYLILLFLWADRVEISKVFSFCVCLHNISKFQFAAFGTMPMLFRDRVTREKLKFFASFCPACSYFKWNINRPKLMVSRISSRSTHTYDEKQEAETRTYFMKLSTLTDYHFHGDICVYISTIIHFTIILFGPFETSSFLLWVVFWPSK